MSELYNTVQGAIFDQTFWWFMGFEIGLMIGIPITSRILYAKNLHLALGWVTLVGGLSLVVTPILAIIVYNLTVFG